MRRIHPKILIPVFLLVALALASTSWAGPRKWGRANLTPEQAAQVFDLKHQFMNDTANLRKQIWVKRAEMAQLWKAEKPDEKAIVAKQKELNALRDQMMEKSVGFRLKMKQIAPELGRFGFGRGMDPGRGMGRGAGMGMGPGACFGPGGGPGFGPGPNLSEVPGDFESDFDLSMALAPVAE
jgi:Spy/CpxP family protein refolding chaperone